MLSPQDQLKTIRRGATEIIEEKELLEKLAKGKPLRIKAGFDPTAPDLHLGHTVLIQKLKQFQDLGHQVIFLIGDYTARVGDPSGRSSTRPQLSEEEIEANLVTYEQQVFKILDRSKTEVRRNSEWLAKMTALETIQLGSYYTVARMMERNDFKKRLAEGSDVSVLEFYYPLFQAYDSVVLKADVELGGSDQKFNLLLGRTIQKRMGQAQQIVLTMPLLEGTDGVQKMSKSYNNYIGIQEAAGDIFGKVLSITDELMWRYYELLSSKSVEEIAALKAEVAAGTVHPKQAKVNLAKEMVARFHSAEAADHAEKEFEKVFAAKGVPTDIETETLPASEPKPLAALLTQLKMTASNGEAKRLIKQGGVSLNEERVSDEFFNITCSGEYLIQVGKRRFKKVIFQ